MSPLYAFRFDHQTDPKTSVDILMIFVATGALDPDAFATLIEAEIEKNLRPDAVLLVVRDPSFNATKDVLQNHSTIITALNRLGTRATVTLAGYDHRGAELRRDLVRGPRAKQEIRFEHFRRRGVSSIFGARRGFVEATGTYHFENPSGRHTERFIRLSNILVRGAEIAFVAFCTLPYIPEKASIAYLDTPSLYAVIAAINEQRSSFQAVTPILADNFSSYGGLHNYVFDRGADAFILISGSSSGSLASDLQTKFGFEAKQIIHLLFLGKDRSNSHIVCDLRHSAKKNPEGVENAPTVETASSCRMCAAGSKPIKLQGDQFEFAGPQQEPLLIKKDFAPPGLQDLVERIAGHEILKVGIGKSLPSLPRLFEIDPRNLLRSAPFRERLAYGVRRSIPASLRYVIALDTDSQKLAQEVATAVPSATVIDRSQLGQISDSGAAIAVVAAVIESGRSLLDVSRDLRSIAPAAPIFYMVGFSKTTGEKGRDSLRNSLVQTKNHYPYEMLEVEKLVLPASTGRNPWAEELDLLLDPPVQALVEDRLQHMVVERVHQLRQTSSPLSDGLFLANAPGRRLELQPGFVFWPAGKVRQHSDADVFFTIACVLQQLRANSGGRKTAASITSNWFQQTILAAGNFGRFNDDIIQASILRAAHPFEMNYADAASDSQELGRLIRRMVESAETPRGGAAAEFLLALATRRLRLCEKDLRPILTASATASPMVTFLQEVCRLRLLQPTGMRK